MAQNTNPVFPLTPALAWGVITTANTAKDGTGTVTTVFTADGTNGGKIAKIKARAAGTNTASVARVFINNGSTNATAANNTLYMERSLPATTLSEVAETADIEIPLNIALPAGYKVNVAIGTTVSAGWAFTGVAGQF